MPLSLFPLLFFPSSSVLLLFFFFLWRRTRCVWPPLPFVNCLWATYKLLGMSRLFSFFIFTSAMTDLSNSDPNSDLYCELFYRKNKFMHYKTCLFHCTFLYFNMYHIRLHCIRLHLHPWHFSFKLMPFFLTLYDFMFLHTESILN